MMEKPSTDVVLEAKNGGAREVMIEEDDDLSEWRGMSGPLWPRVGIAGVTFIAGKVGRMEEGPCPSLLA